MISQLLDNWSNKMMIMLEVVKSKKDVSVGMPDYEEV